MEYQRIRNDLLTLIIWVIWFVRVQTHLTELLVVIASQTIIRLIIIWKNNQDEIFRMKFLYFLIFRNIEGRFYVYFDWSLFLV